MDYEGYDEYVEHCIFNDVSNLIVSKGLGYFLNTLIDYLENKQSTGNVVLVEDFIELYRLHHGIR